MVTALEYVSELVSLPPPIEVIKTECLSLNKCVSTDNLNTASLHEHGKSTAPLLRARHYNIGMEKAWRTWLTKPPAIHVSHTHPNPHTTG